MPLTLKGTTQPDEIGEPLVHDSLKWFFFFIFYILQGEGVTSKKNSSFWWLL